MTDAIDPSGKNEGRFLNFGHGLIKMCTGDVGGRPMLLLTPVEVAGPVGPCAPTPPELAWTTTDDTALVFDNVAGMEALLYSLVTLYRGMVSEAPQPVDPSAASTEEQWIMGLARCGDNNVSWGLARIIAAQLRARERVDESRVALELARLRADEQLAMEAFDYGLDDSRWVPGTTAVQSMVAENKRMRAELFRRDQGLSDLVGVHQEQLRVLAERVAELEAREPRPLA